VTTVRVYNPRLSPVVYGNGQTIGGLEWADVNYDLVHEFISFGDLIVAKDQPPIQETAPEPIDEIQDPAPAEEVENILVENSIDDSSVEETEVPSVDVSSDEVADVSVDDAPSDEAETIEKPATIKKPRRRKTTTTEKE
jgi:hypothetical protein